MTDLDSALQPWQKLFDKYQPDTEIRHAFIGDGNGTVTVPDLPGWSWVRYDDIQSKLSMVRNHRYGLLPDGTPIVVGRRHHTDKYEQVLRVDFASYASGMDQATVDQYILAPHGVSHRGLGSDPAPIDLNNIVVGKVIPDDPASLSVEIYSFVYEYACALSIYDGEVLDLTAHVPVDAGTHRYVLVYLVQTTGAAAALAGTVGPVPAGPPAVPDALSSTIPLAIVLLVNGQTTILIADIIQWKVIWSVACGTVGVHTHTDDSSGGSSLIGIEEFMFACHEPIFLIGNAIWPTEAYHELQISTMYDGLNVEVDLVWIHPDPVHGCGQILILKVADPGIYTTYKVNVRHGVGNILLGTGADVALKGGEDHLILIYNGQNWCDLRTLRRGDMTFDDAEFVVFDKASGNGIKVDTTTPTFGWRDLLGDVFARNTGASKPAFTTYRDTLLDYQFAAGDEEYFKFHIPHDYVGGTDIHLHFHWSHTGALVTGGTVTFEYEVTYAKGHNQAIFPASVSGTIGGTASTTQYQHIISEGQLSASAPSGSQIDSDDLEPDGVIIMRAGLQANDITVSGGGVPDPFIHFVDIHYQTTNIGTKDKAPDFYA